MPISIGASAPLPLPRCKKCHSDMQLACVLASRTSRPEVRAFRCEPCDWIVTLKVEGGALQQWWGGVPCTPSRSDSLWRDGEAFKAGAAFLALAVKAILRDPIREISLSAAKV
jgi:hypothetical protein